MGGPERLRDRVAGEVAAGLPDLERHRRFQQADVDLLAITGAVAEAQRGQDGVGAEQRGREIGDGHADLHRRRPGSPVMDINPLIPCRMRSSAARSRYGPVCPNPDAEA